MKIPESIIYHVFRVYYKGRTYDSDYAEDLLIYADFDVRATAEIFQKYFQDFCSRNGLVENHSDVYLGNIVHFEDLERYLDNNKGIPFRGEMYEMTNPYSTGWIFMDESKVVEINHSHTEKEV